MKVAPEVDSENVHPAIWVALGLIAVQHRDWTDKELVITSLRRLYGSRRSLHAPLGNAPVCAADLRRWYLDANIAEDRRAKNFARNIQVRWGHWLGVVLEPEWLSAEQLEDRGGIEKVAPHIHIQLKTFNLLPKDI